MDTAKSIAHHESEDEDASRNVQVYVRIRPQNDREREQGGSRICLEQGEVHGTITILTRPDSKTFSYDHVAGENSSQEDVFQKVGKPISDTCVAGYNGTIFAYGQTGSGKTHTIQGSFSSPAERGLMPRVFEYLCSQISRKEKATGNNRLKYVLKGSFLEIYNERIYDLLEPQSHSLNVREDLKRGIYVENLTEHTVSSAADCMEIMRIGVQNRRIGETAMNRESSRSHCVFCISIQSEEIIDGLTTTRHSRFNMIDLAGSERQSTTQAAGERLKEASQINKSLSALGNVIMSLVEVSRSGKDRHVHYRDSKLTFLLKDSLGGNSLTYLIACVSPSYSNIGETLSTLKFATRAKYIKNNAVINEDQSATRKVLQDENTRLQQLVAQLQAIQSANGRRMSLGLQQRFTSPAKTQHSALTVVSEEQGGEGEKISEDINIVMIQDSLVREREAHAAIERLTRDLASLEQLSDQQQKQLLSSNMILRLRNRSIEQLRQRIGTSNVDKGEAEHIARLTQELEALQHSARRNPEVVRKMIQINALQDRIVDLEASGKAVNATAAGNSLQIAEKVVLLTEANIRLKEELADLKAQLQDPNKLLESMQTPQKRKFEAFELEKWKQEQAFDQRLQTFEEKLAATRSELEVSESQREDASTKLKEALFQLEESRSTSDVLRLRHEMDKKRLNKLHEQAMRQALEAQLAQQEQRGEEQRGEFSLEIALITAQWETCEAENKQLQAQVSERDEDVIKLRDTVSRLEASLQSSEVKLLANADAFKTAKILTETKEKAFEERLFSLQQSLNAATADESALQEQLKAAQLVVAEMDAMRQIMRGQESSIVSLQAELESKSSELESVSFNFRMLEEDAESTMQDLDEKTSHNKVLQEEVLSLKAEIATAVQANEKVQDKILVQAQLIDSMKEELAKLAAYNVELKEVMLEKQHLRELLEATQQEALEMQVELKETYAKHLAATATVTEMKNVEATLRVNVEELAAVFRESQRNLEQKSAALSQAEQDLEQVNASLLASEELLADRNYRVSELEADVEQVAADMSKARAAYQHDCQGLRATLDVTVSQLSSTVKQGREQEKALQRSCDEIISLKAELDAAAHMEKVNIVVREQGFQQEVRNLQERMAGMMIEFDAEAESLHSRLDAGEGERATLEYKNKQLSSLLEETSRAKEIVTEEVEVLRERLAGVNAVLDEINAGGAVDSASTATTTSSVASSIGSALREVITKLESQYQKTRRSLAEAHGEVDLATLRIRELEACNKELVKDLAASQQELSAVQATSAQANEALAEALSKLQKLKGEVDAREAKFTLLLSNLESLGEQKGKELEKLKAQFSSLRSEHATTMEAMGELRQHLTSVEAAQKNSEKKEKNFESEKAKLVQLLAAAKEMTETHKADADSQTFEVARLNAETDALQQKLKKSLQDKKEWLEEMQRCKAEEESVFQESERLREELEKEKEQTVKAQVKISELESDNNRLNKLNEKLSGHQNTKQKIQHHMQIKKENDILKQDKLFLQKENKKLRRALGDKADVIVATSIKEDDDLMLTKLSTTEHQLQELMKKVSSIATASIGTENFEDDAFKSLLLGVEAPAGAHNYDLRTNKVARKEVDIDSTLRNVENLVAQVKEGETKLRAAERRVESYESKIRMLEKARQLQENRQLFDADNTDFEFQDSSSIFRAIQSPMNG